MEAVIHRVVRYTDPQRFRILADGAAIGSCVVQIRGDAEEGPHELWFSANLRPPQMPGPPLRVHAATRFNHDTTVESSRIRAVAGGFSLDAAADAESGEIVWRLAYGGVFNVEQRTPIRSLAGLALAGPLGLPGIGDWQGADPGVVERIAGAEPVSLIRLDRLGPGNADVCFVIETKLGEGETVSTWVRPDGRIARIESSFGFAMEPMEEPAG